VAILFGPWLRRAQRRVGEGGRARLAVAPLDRPILVIEAFITAPWRAEEVAARSRARLALGCGRHHVVIAPQWYAVEYLRRSIWPIALQVVLNGLVAIVVADLIATAPPCSIS